MHITNTKGKYMRTTKNTLIKPKSKMLWIESNISEAASNRAIESGFSFSEYIARLIVKDLKRKADVSRITARTLPVFKK
jgi:hypothetical protein